MSFDRDNLIEALARFDTHALESGGDLWAEQIAGDPADEDDVGEYDTIKAFLTPYMDSLALSPEVCAAAALTWGIAIGYELAKIEDELEVAA